MKTRSWGLGELRRLQGEQEAGCVWSWPTDDSLVQFGLSAVAANGVRPAVLLQNRMSILGPHLTAILGPHLTAAHDNLQPLTRAWLASVAGT